SGARAIDVSFLPPEALLYSPYARDARIGPSAATMSARTGSIAPRPAARGSGTDRISQAEYGASATSPGAAPTGAGSATAHSESGQPATALDGVWGSGRSTTDAAPACSRSAARWSAPPGPATTTAATGRPTERAPSTVSSAWLATSAPPGATTTTVAPRRRAASRTRPSPSRTGASSPGAERTVTPSGAWRSSARTRSRMSNPCVVETSSNSGTRRRLPAGRRSAGSSAALEQRQPVRVDELGDRGRVAEVAVLAGQDVAPSPGDAAQHG